MTMQNNDGGLQVNLHQLLKAMIEKGASDMHITTSSPPLLRIDGSIVPLKHPPLSPVHTKALCYSVLTEEQKIQFEKNNAIDLSFGVKNLSRFRANIYMQRGAVSGAFRAIPFKILTFEELGLPPIAAELKLAAIRSGMNTLRMAGNLKIMQGVTSPEEVMRVTMAD